MIRQLLIVGHGLEKVKQRLRGAGSDQATGVTIQGTRMLVRPPPARLRFPRPPEQMGPDPHPQTAEGVAEDRHPQTAEGVAADRQGQGDLA